MQDTNCTDDEREMFLNMDDPEITILDDGNMQNVDTDDEGDFGNENVLRVHTKPVHCVAIHPTGSIFATGGEDDAVVLWSSENPNEQHHILSGHEDTVLCLAFQPTGTYLVSGGMDGAVILWKDLDSPAPRLDQRLTHLSDDVLWVLWHSSGKFFTAGCSGGHAVLWSLTGEALQYFSCGGAVNVGIWSQDEKRLILGETNGVRVFHPKSADALFCPIPNEEYPTAICTLKNTNDAILCGLVSGKIVSVSIAQRKIACTLQELHEQPIESISHHPTIDLILCVSCDALVSVWNVDRFSLRYAVRCPNAVIKGIWYEHTVIVAMVHGEVLAWDGRDECNDATSRRFEGHRGAVLDIAILGNRLITTGDDTTIRIYNLEA